VRTVIVYLLFKALENALTTDRQQPSRLYYIT